MECGGLTEGTSIALSFKIDQHEGHEKQRPLSVLAGLVHIAIQFLHNLMGVCSTASPSWQMARQEYLWTGFEGMGRVQDLKAYSLPQ
jgi:hypothetical protein